MDVPVLTSVLAGLSISDETRCWTLPTRALGGHGYAVLQAPSTTERVKLQIWAAKSPPWTVEGEQLFETHPHALVHHHCRNRPCFRPEALLALENDNVHRRLHLHEAAERGKSPVGACGEASQLRLPVALYTWSRSPWSGGGAKVKWYLHILPPPERQRPSRAPGQGKPEASPRSEARDDGGTPRPNCGSRRAARGLRVGLDRAIDQLRRFDRMGIDEGTEAVQLVGELRLYGPIHDIGQIECPRLGSAGPDSAFTKCVMPEHIPKARADATPSSPIARPMIVRIGRPPLGTDRGVVAR
jgi:hypothetical protein